MIGFAPLCFELLCFASLRIAPNGVALLRLRRFSSSLKFTCFSLLLFAFLCAALLCAASRCSALLAVVLLALLPLLLAFAFALIP